jgi:hypothetical protein
MYAIATTLMRVRCIMLERERTSAWVQELSVKVSVGVK